MITEDMIFEVMNEFADLLSKRKRIEVLKDQFNKNPRFKDHPNRECWLAILDRADQHYVTHIELVIRKLELAVYAKS